MDLTDIIERYRHGFEDLYGARSTRQLNHAIDVFLACHSERYGEVLLECSPCNHQKSYFHACGHRAGMYRCRVAHGCARAAIDAVSSVSSVSSVSIMIRRSG